MCTLLAKPIRRTTMSLSLKKLQKRAHAKSPEGPDNNKPTKKKFTRFEGLTEQEIMEKESTLSDILDHKLDLVFVGINPSLMAAYTGRYYAGPGNHFYKLLCESGLVSKPVSYENDKDLLEYGIGLTNIVARATRSSADLTRLELKKGAAAVHDKLKKFKPKVAVFNGKCIYEEFADKYDKSSFRFGLQPHRVGDTVLWVVPSSSARCANFPRMQDKLHFYTSLKRYLAHLKGELPEAVDPEEFRFDGKCKQAISSTSKMWRRKGISAFANGGRVVNKETFSMDTSDESLCIPWTNEFIVKNVKKESEDSGVSASQSSEEVSLDSESDIVRQEPSLGSDISQELLQENGAESSISNSKEQSDSKLKKKQQSSRKLSRSVLPGRTAASVLGKERNETIDFMSLIKQRLSNKEEVMKNNEDDCDNESSSKPGAGVKGLKYQNLCSDKLKRGFKVKYK
ncbi:G/T mismatch-specific thymine DNA glycosylase-like [Copidosoma floridanum]|uniref:G/T mismatch-specific thymine DNA glycosylase-like n=1 Tax=Copidosoma floridanum TaxID=29053 RepID=UPI0006C96DAF|nr:G/T mismatch-specific thymine DNA glycosylase-like [Copidosoma floridanum]